jgi:hypothetical protein
MSRESSENIINEYKTLYETKEGYDTIIYTGGKLDLKAFYVHSFILKTNSKFFRTIFAENNVKKSNGYFILNLYYSPEVLEILFRYIFFFNI